MSAQKTAQADGVFARDHAYTLSELRRRGFGASALREMQRRGLAARRVGKVKIVLGADLLAFFEQAPVETLAH
jgi:hypothetical protein